MPQLPRITSRQHDLVRRFRQTARRPSDGVVLLDGEHLIEDALDSGVAIDVVLTDDAHAKLGGRARAAGASVYEASQAVIEAASPVRSPSGIVALARWQPASVADVLKDQHAFVIALCGVQDPGNVGSVIRAADALGATGVLVLDDTAHPAGWKALRGSMGSAFRVPVAIGSAAAALEAAVARGLQIVATSVAAGLPLDSADLRLPSVVLLGSEGAGLSPEVLARAGTRITIPMSRGVNSLNVGATAAVILYEARRQRSS